MHKLKFSARIFICLLMAMTLFACGKKEEAKKEEKTKTLKLSNNVSLDIPETWKILSMSENAKIIDKGREKVIALLGDAAPKDYEMLLTAFSDKDDRTGVMVIAYGEETTKEMKMALEEAKDPEKMKQLDETMKMLLDQMLSPSGFSDLDISPTKIVEFDGFKGLSWDVTGKNNLGKEVKLTLHQLPLSKTTIQVILIINPTDSALASQTTDVEKSIKIKD